MFTVLRNPFAQFMATNLVEHTANNSAKFSLVRDGVAGNLDVVAKMIELVRNSIVFDKGLENFFKQILIENGIDSHTPVAQKFAFIYEYVTDSVKYIQDSAGNIESIKDARTTLQDGYGDCDDLSILFATWLASLGYEPSIVMAKYIDDDSANFQHVYTSVTVNGERYVFDGAIKNGSFNSEVPAAQLEEIGVFHYNAKVDGIGGTVRGLKGLVHDAKKNGLEAINLFSGLLPLGFIPAQAVHIGTSLFGSATVNPKSLSAIGSRTSGILTDIIIELQNGRLALEVAQNRARRAMGTYYGHQHDFPNEQAKYDTIKKTLLDKLEYIENFGKDSLTAPLAINLNPNLMLVAGIGIVGLGAYVYFNNRG